MGAGVRWCEGRPGKDSFVTTQIAETARVAALRNRLVREILAPATGLAPEVVDRAGSIR